MYRSSRVSPSPSGGGKSIGFCSSPLEPIIKKLKDAGSATVISSGNDFQDNAVSFPVCVRQAVTVGSSGKFVPLTRGGRSKGYSIRISFSNSGNAWQN